MAMDLPITSVVIKTEFEGVHCYPEAPEEVDYLRYRHRHMFKVELEIEVFHDDRELEFIIVKHRVMEAFEKELHNKSCEMIAKEIQLWAKQMFPHKGKPRRVNVGVFEDGENGARVRDF